jgi:endoglucanase
LRGTVLTARGHDDVISVAAIAAMLDEARRRKMKGSFHALFTRCEEGGFWGAIGACKAHSLPKDAVIVALEASRELPNARLGDGVVARVGDRTSTFTPWVSAALAQAATALAARGRGFRFLRRLMDGGTCESTVYGAYGYDTGALCVPLRNYHNVDWDRMKLAAEQVDTRDFESLVSLLLYMGEHGVNEPSRAQARQPFEDRMARLRIAPTEHVARPRGGGAKSGKTASRKLAEL